MLEEDLQGTGILAEGLNASENIEVTDLPGPTTEQTPVNELDITENLNITDLALTDKHLDSTDITTNNEHQKSTAEPEKAQLQDINQWQLQVKVKRYEPPIQEQDQVDSSDSSSGRSRAENSEDASDAEESDGWQPDSAKNKDARCRKKTN